MTTPSASYYQLIHDLFDVTGHRDEVEDFFAMNESDRQKWLKEKGLVGRPIHTGAMIYLNSRPYRGGIQ